MGKTLDSLLNIGKKVIVAGAALLTLNGCYHGAWGPVRAKRDYAQYPGYKKEIAFYNIKQILTDPHVCDDPFVGESRFSCRSKGPCLNFSTGYSSQGYNSYSRASNTVATTTCTSRESASISTRWSDIKSVHVEGTCLKFEFYSNYEEELGKQTARLGGNKDLARTIIGNKYTAQCHIYTFNRQQAQDLKEAIDNYTEGNRAARNSKALEEEQARVESSSPAKVESPEKKCVGFDVDIGDGWSYKCLKGGKARGCNKETGKIFNIFAIPEGHKLRNSCGR